MPNQIDRAVPYEGIPCEEFLNELNSVRAILHKYALPSQLRIGLDVPHRGGRRFPGKDTTEIFFSFYPELPARAISTHDKKLLAQFGYIEHDYAPPGKQARFEKRLKQD